MIFFQPLLNKEVVISNMHNKSEQDKNLFRLLRPQSKISKVKCEKSQQIDHFAFFLAIIELVQELATSNIQTTFEKYTYMKNYSSYRAHK